MDHVNLKKNAPCYLSFFPFPPVFFLFLHTRIAIQISHPRSSNLLGVGRFYRQFYFLVDQVEGGVDIDWQQDLGFRVEAGGDGRSLRPRQEDSCFHEQILGCPEGGRGREKENGRSEWGRKRMGEKVSGREKEWERK